MMTDEEAPNKTTKGEEVDPTESTSAPAIKEGGVTVGGVHVTDAQLPMVGMFFSALILLVAVLVPGSWIKYWAYGISLATIAMVFAVLGFALTFSEDMHTKLGPYNAYFLFLWCFIGACIMTFAGPFTVTGNGYFASWGMAVASCMGVGVTGSQAKSVLEKVRALLGLGACSVVVIIAVISPLTDGINRGPSIYAIVLACCTVCVVAAFSFMKEKISAQIKFGTLALFAIMWVVMAFLVTFEGPFLATGNGYFASWGGAIASIIATMAALKEMKE